MNMTDIRSLRKTGTLLLLLLFTAYVSGTSLFIHTHIVGGTTVTHSHPYKGSSDSHTHSAQQFNAIASLSHFAATGAAYVAGLLTPLDAVEISTCTRTRRAISPLIRHYGLRAPPAIGITR